MWVYKVSCKKLHLRCQVWFKKLSQPECKLLEISFNEFGSPLRITIGYQDTILASTLREAINGFLKELQIYLFFCPRYYKKRLGVSFCPQYPEIVFILISVFSSFSKLILHCTA